MKKIMFNDRFGLTEAVLDGRKTMTRRIIPPIEVDWNRRGKVTLPVSGYNFGALWMDCRQFLPDSGLFDYTAPQKYQPLYDFGEEVAIAQSYRDIFDEAERGDYWADCYERFRQAQVDDKPGWNNKMFVAADLMPHRIRITGIKAERLQDISEEDCLKEGIQEYFPYIDRNPNDKVRTFQYLKNGKIRHRISPAQECFALLIDDICGKGTWKKNPWVYVYNFELIK